MVTVGVKVTAMISNKADGIFQKTYVRAGMTPTTRGNGQNIGSVQSHMDLSVYYEGPLPKGNHVHLLYDEPVKTKYIFLEAHLDTASRWGFAEIYVLVGEQGLIYCENGDPLTGVAASDKASVRVFSSDRSPGVQEALSKPKICCLVVINSTLLSLFFNLKKTLFFQFDALPTRFARKHQCIELCRGQNHILAVENIQTKKCACLKNDPGTLSISRNSDSCADKANWVTVNIHLKENTK